MVNFRRPRAGGTILSGSSVSSRETEVRNWIKKLRSSEAHVLPSAQRQEAIGGLGLSI
jgi:hypothetical protein